MNVEHHHPKEQGQGIQVKRRKGIFQRDRAEHNEEYRTGQRDRCPIHAQQGQMADRDTDNGQQDDEQGQPIR